MKNVQRLTSLVNWIRTRRFTLMLSLIVALFLAVVAPARSAGSGATTASAYAIASPSEAPTPSKVPAENARGKALVLARHSELTADSSEPAFLKDFGLVTLTVPSSGTTPRPVGMMFQGGSCLKCGSRRCAQEYLCCPAGWAPQWTSDDHCCAQCWQGGTSGQESCCYMF